MVSGDSCNNLEDGAAAVRRAVSWRSVLLGLAGVSLIASTVAFNDLVVENTFLIGGSMPVAVVALLFVLVVAVNAPLWRWFPRQALTAGELAVALAMMLVSCAVPGSGFVQYITGLMVGIPAQAALRPDVAAMLQGMGLPDWVFPSFTEESYAARAREPVIANYIGRLPEGAAVPWMAWLAPAIAWGVWGAAFFGAILCMCILFRRQWVENERLPFPIATVYGALIESPPPGRIFNTLFRMRTFWIALAVVVVLRSWNGMSLYFPREVPPIPLGYDFTRLFGDPPLLHADQHLKRSTIFFAVIGLTFFLQSRIALSIWLFYVLYQIAKINVRMYGGDISLPMRQDQMAGAAMVLAMLVIWVGRGHMALIGRQMIRGHRRGEPQEPYLPLAVAGWGLVICCLVMIVWLILAGASVFGATVIVVALLTLLLMIARIGAETGLYYAQINVPMNRPWLNALPMQTSGASYFWTTYMGAVFAHDTRECSTVFTTHALRTMDGAGAAPQNRRQAYKLVGALLLAMFAAYVIGWTAQLNTNYHHAITLSERAREPVNWYGIEHMTRNLVVDPTLQYAEDRVPQDYHSRLGHVSFGAAVTATLGFLRLRGEGFPFHPLGFVLAYTYPVSRMWFSIAVGWLAKVLLLKFGGATLYRSARPFFIGLIVGEALGVAIWLAVSLTLASLGMQYKVLFFTP